MVVTINNHPHELHFGMRAIRYFYNKVGVLSESASFETDMMAELIWGALDNAAYRQQKSLAISFAAVVDFVEEGVWDEERQVVLTKISEEFAASKAVQKFKEITEKEEDEIKKKAAELISTSSNPSASGSLDGQSTNTSAAA